MRLSILLIFAFVMAAQARSFSQVSKLTLDLSKVKLVDVLNEIEEQTDYYFYFNLNIDNYQVNQVNAKDQDIREVLNKMLPDLGLDYEIVDRYIVIKHADKITGKDGIFAGSQQQIKVSGKVTDSSGVPLPGVTVVVKGTATGIITDSEGNYSLKNIPADATLVFSFVGMKTEEVPVAGKTDINVTMAEETIGIEEVVAIGYGTMKRKDLTGSVQSIGADEIEKRANVSVIQSLQGRLPGLNVGPVTEAGQDPGMTIRGRTSISGTQSPLVVLDGVIYRGQLVDLNVNDIESIDVLKDASSAAIYGSQAANGVVLITTKSGKVMGKPVIGYSGYYSFQSPAKLLRPMNREEFLKKQADVDFLKSRLAPDYLEANPSWNVTSTFVTDNSQLVGYNNGTDTDWYDFVTNDHPFMQNHDLSIKGRNDRMKYYLSTGYTQQEGFVKNDDYKKINVRVNFDFDITNWLQIGMQSFLTSDDYSGSNITLREAIYLDPLMSPYDENGELRTYPNGTVLNPILRLRDIDDFEKGFNLRGNFYSNITIPWVKGLSYRLNYSTNYRNTNHYQMNPFAATGLGTAFKDISNAYDNTLDHILTFNRTFNDDHNVHATLVYGFETREGEGTNATGTGFNSFTLGYNGLEYGDATQRLISSSAYKESSLYSMARLFYGYKNKYLITGTVRRDGFSGFSKNNKFGIFPALALGWVASEEAFLKDNIKWIDYLKLRGSYGANGNRTIGRYSTLAHIASGVGYVFGEGGSPALMQYISSMANDALTWETTIGTNLGIDFQVMNNRLSGSLEYYITDTHDMLYTINIPSTTGFTSTSINIGKIHNNGIELSLNGAIVRTEDFSWSAEFVFSRNRNQVKTILGRDDNNDGKEDDLVDSGIFIGKPYGVIYEYEVIGKWQLSDTDIPGGFYPGNYKFRDFNDDGKYTPDKDRTIIGYTDPSYRFGISNKLSYKNFTLNVFINSIQGGKDYYYGYEGPDHGVGIRSNALLSNWLKWDYWMPENPNGKYSRLDIQPGVNSVTGNPVKQYAQRNFIRLQDVLLSYAFNSKTLKKYGLGNLNVFASGKNLITWTKWDGWDPETGVGISEYGLPVMKSYTFGVNFEF